MSVTEIKIPIEKVREALDYITAFFGEDFIHNLHKNSLFNRIEGTSDIGRKQGHLSALKSHPLSEIWEKGQANFQDFIQRHKTFRTKAITLHYSLKVNLSKELLQLTDIAEDLKEVSEIDVTNERGELRKTEARQLWGKRLKDLEGFEKAIYEIRVAASLKRNGYRVCFLEERTGKTPDFIVEKDGEKTYVECKQKDKKSERDQRNQTIWDTVLTSSLKCMDRSRKNYGIIVKSEVDLSNKNSSLLINRIRSLIGNSQSGTYREGDFEIIAKELQQFDKGSQGCFSVNLEDFGVKGDFPTELIQQSAIVKYSQTSEAEYKNPRFMVFVSAVMPDRIRSILDSLNHAYKQIPKGGPGIIYIEINTSLYRNPEEIAKAFQFVEKRINGKLNLVKRVNSVILTASSYFQKGDKTFYKVEMTHFKNSNPTSSLSDRFLAIISNVKIR